MTGNHSPQAGASRGDPALPEPTVPAVEPAGVRPSAPVLPPAARDPGPVRPSFLTAVRFWCWLGFISFGGPAGQIGTMHAEVVERRRWVAERRFLHALNYCMVLPGPEATQLAIYIGWLLHGIAGGLAAGLLFLAPSVVLLTGLGWLYMTFGDTPVVRAMFWGVKPAVVAVVLTAVLRIGRRALDTRLALALAGFAFVTLWFHLLPFPLILAVAGSCGLLRERFGRAHPGSPPPDKSPDPPGASAGPSVIDDETAVAAHDRRRILGHAVVAILAWVGPMVILVLTTGTQSPPTHMAWFFTETALYTFGGAYAVLPFVRDHAIAAGWARPEQIIDGLAFGETTPGPLIMIVTFIGFLGGWQTWGHGLPGAVACALTATYFTFLPSFVFVLLGAPFIERLRGEVRLTAVLTGITAAVVGVIFSLAVSLGLEVAWPHAGPTDWPACGLILIAFVCLWRFKLDLIAVVVGCGSVGLMTLVRG